MFEGWRIEVVMPARDEAQHITEAISGLPRWIDRVLVVDDGSMDQTAVLARSAGAEILSLAGAGVGAAISAGYQHLVASAGPGRWCAVVIAGDGQMDPADLPALLQPIISEQADFVKGDRTSHPDGLKRMPLRRRLGSWWLKHLTNLASGLSIDDPQCGYTVCSDHLLQRWDFGGNWNGYGYPNWWLLQCSVQSWKVMEAPVRAVYDGQASGIKILTFLPSVSWMLLKGLLRRGCDWYIIGRCKASSAQRSALLVGFFGGLAVLASAPWTGLLAGVGTVGLVAARLVDRQVAKRQTEGLVHISVEEKPKHNTSLA